MQSLAIVLLCIISAIIYGILHDLVTAHLCVEYFTIGHAPIFATDDPVRLALGWGVIATWWVGAILGVLLAVVARVGARPKRSVVSLIRLIAGLLACMAALAAIAGLIGWLLANGGMVSLGPTLGSRVPRERHALFLADLWAHSTSYLVGFVGGIVVMVRVWRARGREM